MRILRTVGGGSGCDAACRRLSLEPAAGARQPTDSGRARDQLRQPDGPAHGHVPPGRHNLRLGADEGHRIRHGRRALDLRRTADQRTVEGGLLQGRRRDRVPHPELRRIPRRQDTASKRSSTASWSASATSRSREPSNAIRSAARESDRFGSRDAQESARRPRTRATAVTIVATAMNGSCAWMPYSCEVTSVPARSLPASRRQADASSTSTSFITSQITPPGSAPSAMRRPSSLLRRVTTNAITP